MPMKRCICACWHWVSAPAKQIEMIRKASFSGPLQVRIGTTDVMLRRSEADKIKVQVK